MQVKKLVAACGLAFAAAGAQAYSVDTTGYVKIFLSGATAPDSFLQDLANSLLTGVVSFREQTTPSSAANNYRAFMGDAKPGIPGVPAGTKILFIKRSKGGSVWGVDPVARANRIETLDFSDCTSGAGYSGGYTHACKLKGIDPGLPGNDSPSNPGEVPDFGVSDVEPAMFREPFNTENNQPALSPAETARLTAVPVNQLMMGIVATNAVPATTYISRAAYTNMLAGKLRDWSLVDDSLTGGNTNVVVCRRVDGSGTQASYNWYFNNFPCQSNEGGTLDPATVNDSDGILGGSGTEADPIVIDPTAGYTVVENSSSGNVRDCLKAAQNLTDHKVKGELDKWYLLKFSNAKVENGGNGQPFRAIGILSLDSYGKESGWSFRMLDGAGTFNAATQTASSGATGVAPSKANLVNGKYDFAVELSMQYRNQTVLNPNGDTVPVSSPLKQAFINEFIKQAGSTKYTANVGGSFTTVPNAYASLPQYYDPYDSANNDPVTNTWRVSFYSREANTCAPLKRF